MAKLTYGIIGYPIKHSLSPYMQAAAFKALGIDAEYKAFEVAPSDVGSFMKSAAVKAISGFNVTIPHKIAAKDYLLHYGHLDETAKKLGAVNTVNITSDSMKGYNTDGPGFYRSLQEELKFEPEGKNVFILGAGGAARAVAMYLGDGPRRIRVYDVDAAKKEDLRAHYREYYDPEKFETVDEADIKVAIEQSQLLVNATPMGMKEGDPMPVDKSMLHPGLYVYDLVYNRQTELVREAARMKLHATTGLGMLLYQGAIAFEIWTGKKAPVDVMRRALKDALRG
jgi:shikimate dehydrogenase